MEPVTLENVADELNTAPANIETLFTEMMARA